MARYAAPGTDGSVVTFKPRYDHFIGGEYVAPKKGQYFENPTPVTGETFTEVYTGTLGPSIRAIAPVRDGTGRIVGLVSAGILQQSLADRWRSQVPVN